MPTFCRKPQVASFYSSLKQPCTKFIITLSRFSGKIFKIWNNLAKEGAELSKPELSSIFRSRMVGYNKHAYTVKK